MAYRVDIGELKKPERLPDGRIIVDGLLTRTGVFVYTDATGKDFREYRPAGEVFDAESLKSFQLVPVTNNHPEGMVSAENAKDVSVGTVGESVRRDDRFVRAPLAINDATTIQQMERGKVELSCGYTADLEFTAGVSPDGEHYDAIQRNIRGNHVAIVDRGRAGPQVKVRLDAHTRVMRNESKGKTMDPEQLKAYQKALADLASAQHEAGVNGKRADTAESALEAEKARADAAEAQVTSLTTERDEATALKDAAEQARKDEAAGAETRVRARMDLEDNAKRILGDEFKADASDRDTQRAIVKKVDGVELSEDAKVHSDVYVRAYADSSLSRAKSNESSLGSIRSGASHTDDGDDPEALAYQNMIKRSDERYKGSN